jgi:hypothetical protein
VCLSEVDVRKERVYAFEIAVAQTVFDTEGIFADPGAEPAAPDR